MDKPFEKSRVALICLVLVAAVGCHHGRTERVFRSQRLEDSLLAYLGQIDSVDAISGRPYFTDIHIFEEDGVAKIELRSVDDIFMTWPLRDTAVEDRPHFSGRIGGKIVFVEINPKFKLLLKSKGDKLSEEDRKHMRPDTTWKCHYIPIGTDFYKEYIVIPPDSLILVEERRPYKYKKIYYRQGPM